MSYKIDKPCTEEEYENFIAEYSQTPPHRRIRENDTAVYALEPWEEWENDEVVDRREEWEEEQRQKEIERINNLTMTALDFINFLKQVGLTDEMIENYLNANLSIKHQLQFCQNVYCGVAKALMPIKYNGITITAEMVEQAFRIKNGEGVA